MDKMRSNFARIWACLVSIARYQEACVWMSNESVSATILFEKATDWSSTYLKSELTQRNLMFLIACNRYEIRLYPCQIWTQVVHSVWEKKRETNRFFSPLRTSCRHLFFYISVRFSSIYVQYVLWWSRTHHWKLPSQKVSGPYCQGNCQGQVFANLKN
jgi:hypothetical protein